MLFPHALHFGLYPVTIRMPDSPALNRLSYGQGGVHIKPYKACLHPCERSTMRGSTGPAHF